MADVKIPLSYESFAYLDTTPTAGTPTYELIGEGITALTPTQNPQTETKQYIHELFSTTTVTSLQKQFAYSGERVVNDPVNDYLASLEDKVGEDLKTTLIIYHDYDETSDGSGTYTAKRYDVVVAVSNPGDRSGGATLAISGTIYVNGDPTEGTFTASTKTFTASA